MSEYGRMNYAEAHAEAFAEWSLTDGKTTSPSTRLYARDLRWPGADRNDFDVERDIETWEIAESIAASAGDIDDAFLRDPVVCYDSPTGASYEWADETPHLDVQVFRFNPNQPRDDIGRWTDGAATSATQQRPTSFGRYASWDIGIDTWGRPGISRNVPMHTGWDNEYGEMDTDSPVEERFVTDDREGTSGLEYAAPPSGDVADRLTDAEVAEIRSELAAAPRSTLDGVALTIPDGFDDASLSDALVLHQLSSHLDAPLQPDVKARFDGLVGSGDMDALRTEALAEFGITPESAFIHAVGSHWNASSLSKLGVAVGLGIDPDAYGYMRSLSSSIGNQRAGDPQVDFQRATEIVAALPRSVALSTEAVRRHTQDVLSEMFPSGEVTVYRGVTRPTADGSVSINPVSSWTLETQWAANFGERSVKATVPVESVLSYGAATGWGALGEAEVILSTPDNTVSIESERTDRRWENFASSADGNIDAIEPDWIKDVAARRSARLDVQAFRFDPNQARHPAGSSQGGRWAPAGGVSSPNSPTAAQALLEAGEQATVAPEDASAIVEAIGASNDAPVDLTNLQLDGYPNLFGEAKNGLRNRGDMPQIPSAQIDNFRRFLQDAGVTITEEVVDPTTVWSTQNELDATKVGQIITATKNGTMKQGHPPWVASDDRILDGHHRWAAHALMEAAGQDRPPMDILRVDLPIGRLLMIADAFNELNDIEAKQHGMALEDFRADISHHLSEHRRETFHLQGQHDQSTHGNRGGTTLPSGAPAINEENGWTFNDHPRWPQWTHDRWGVLDAADVEAGRDSMDMGEFTEVVRLDDGGFLRLSVNSTRFTRSETTKWGPEGEEVFTPGTSVEAHVVHSPEFWRTTGGRRAVGYIGSYGPDLNGRPNPSQGEIIRVDVDSAHRRRGIATEMWKFGKKHIPNFRHSTALTPDGRAWNDYLDEEGLAATTDGFHLQGQHDQSTHGNRGGAHRVGVTQGGSDVFVEIPGIPEPDLSNGTVQKTVKHRGALAVAAAMTDEERRALTDELLTVDPDILFDLDPMILGYGDHLLGYVAPDRRRQIDPLKPGLSAGTRFQLEHLNEAQHVIVEEQGLEAKPTMDDGLEAAVNAWIDSGGDSTAELAMSQYIEERYGISPASGFVHAMNKGWKDSSKGSRSLALHQEVAAQFGIDAGDYFDWINTVVDPREYNRFDRATEIRDALEDSLAAYVSATYRHTQTQLADFDEIVVYRGIKGDNYKPVAGEVVTGNPLSSWTYNEGTATMFSDGFWNDRPGRVLVDRADPADVFSMSATTGLGALVEREVILLGRPQVLDEVRENPTS
jgi:hypothetical protein